MDMSETKMIVEKKELEWVSVIFYHITERIQSWVDAVIEAGATIYEEGSDAVIAAIDHNILKVAVIIGQTDEEHLREIIEAHEEYFSDPVISVRYFLFVRKGEEPLFSHDRIEIVHYRDIAPTKTPEMINKVLYFSRLPPFLRTGYDVEICEELEPFDWISFRKIIIRSYIGEEKELNYETLSLYIHHKDLYEFRELVDPLDVKVKHNAMVKIDENSDIKVRKGKFVHEDNDRFDGPIALSSLNYNNQKELKPTHETSDELREAVC